MSIELATEQELFDELSRRSKGVIVVTVKEAKNDMSQEVRDMYFSGGGTQALGLLKWAEHTLLDPDNE